MEGAEDTQGLELALGTYVLVFALKLAVYAASGVMALPCSSSGAGHWVIPYRRSS